MVIFKWPQNKMLNNSNQRTNSLIYVQNNERKNMCYTASNDNHLIIIKKMLTCETQNLLLIHFPY